MTLRTFLPRLTKLLKSTKSRGLLKPLPSAGFFASQVNLQASKFEQDALWTQLASHLKEGDFTLADAGTCNYGILDARLPSTHMTQSFYSSIGFATGATLG